MKKLIFSLAAVVALAAGTASAQAPMPAGPTPPGGCPTGGPAYGGPVYGGGYYGGGYYGGGVGIGHGFGGHGLFGFGLGGGLFTNHGHSSGKNRDPQNVNTLPVATGGTLVFPQNPFVRSPRDFFMWDER